MPASGAPDALVMLWDLPNQGGPTGSGKAQVIGTGGNAQIASPVATHSRYDRWTHLDLWKVGLSNKISSVSLFTPQVGSTVLIMYSYGDALYSSMNATHFNSDFLLVDNHSGSQFDLNLATRPIMDGNWENCPTSLIVAHTGLGPEHRLSAQQVLTPLWIDLLDEQLAEAGGKVSRNGNPTWEWKAFPTNLKHLNPNHNYLKVSQDLTVSPPGPIADYAARISYYLRLIPSNGTVTGWVQRWEYWVEDGMFAEYVGMVLRPYTILGAESLNDTLAAGAFPTPPGAPISSLYYLPGVQTDATAPGEVKIFQGWCHSDATIVLQFG